MKSIIRYFLIINLLCAFTHADNHFHGNSRQKSQRVLLHLKHNVHPAALDKYNLKIIRRLKTGNGLVCSIDPEQFDVLKQDKNIEKIAADARMRIPDTLITPQQDGDFYEPLSYDGPVTVLWNNLPQGLNAQAAWDNFHVDGNEITIAIIDTGINYTLPDMSDNYLGGYDFVDNDSDPMPDSFSTEWHGTAVASAAVARGFSEIVGVSYHVKYYALRALDESGSGLLTDEIAAIEWASTEPHKADIISMSTGVYESDITFYLKNQLRNACNNALNDGILLVGGSGNDGYSYSMFPAGVESVISVGAHSSSQSLWSSSNGGVDVVSPGVSIKMLWPSGNAYTSTGTSFAVPHVSGLLALQMHFERKNGYQFNNIFHWQVMEHAAIDLSVDPLYQGKGKTYAAATDINDYPGSLGLIKNHWPINFDFEFSNTAFTDGNLAVYHIGDTVNQTITLTNVTDILGNSTEIIEDIYVTATQINFGDPNANPLPGSSVISYPKINTLQPGDGNAISLSFDYSIGTEADLGPRSTMIELEFNLHGDNRTVTAAYRNFPPLWYLAAQGDLDLNHFYDANDYTQFAIRWYGNNCGEFNNRCDKSDIDKNGVVDFRDMKFITDNWLSSAAP